MAVLFNAISVKYSATVTLKPIMYKMTAEEQYDNTKQDLCEMLYKLNTNFTIVAELTKGMNLHYHLVVQFRSFKPKDNLMKKFIDHFRNHKKFGYVSIRQIDDEPGWQAYISKDIDVTYESIRRPPIIYDDFKYYDDMKYMDHKTWEVILDQ